MALNFLKNNIQHTFHDFLKVCKVLKWTKMDKTFACKNPYFDFHACCTHISTRG